ncbi:MAG: hypothetical protein JSS27_04985 [Planctomycetes bacterium]|nr:hypothetical protein [Planctomycetota bacterium]
MRTLVLGSFAALAFFVTTIGSALAGGTYYDVSYLPSEKTGELPLGVTYTVWIPDGDERLRGAIVHQHGCGEGACQGGRTAAYDLHWQALARKWNCALVGPSYHQSKKQNCRLWCDPRNGSNQTFLKALHDIGARSKHAELAEVPWCLWGHSGGGYWASLMQTMYPERIVAIWFRSGTAYATWEKGEIDKPEIPAAAYEIPMMCNPGAKENGDKRFNGAWTGTMSMFKAYRAKGAPIGFAPDPRTSHECGDSRYLAIPFFDACLAQRLPTPGSNSQKLRPVDAAQSYLAPLLGEQASPAAEYKSDAAEAVWLPNAAVAKAWAEYVKDGATSDTTPPTAPTNVQWSRNSDGRIALAWLCDADFESGLQAFVITRNGERVGRVPEQGNTRFGRPLFQGMSYHDTPDPKLAMMAFTTKSPDEAPAEYQVIAVNSAGLESAPATAKPARP